MINLNTTKSQIFAAAHKIYRCKKNSVSTFSEALKLSWTRFKFWEFVRMNKNVYVDFKKKSNGCKRVAAVEQEKQDIAASQGRAANKSITAPYVVSFVEGLGAITQYRSFDLRNVFSLQVAGQVGNHNQIINSVSSITETEGKTLPRQSQLK